MINFIAVDNEKRFLKIIEKEITRACKVNKVKCNTFLFEEYDALFWETVNAPRVGKIMYIFDIETPKENGLNILRRIRKTDNESIAILISGFEKTYSTQIIRDTLNIYTFVSKKGDMKNELFTKLSSAIKYSHEDQYLEFQDSYKKYLLKKDDIVFINAELRKTKINLTDGKSFYVNKTLRYFEERLGKKFVYSHRSCIVNSSLIQTIDQSNRIIYFNNGMKTDYMSSKFLKFYSQV